MNPWDAPELQFDAKTFCGTARLFPLPNLVMYPHVMQPLHIFEERYREMLEDALAGDGLIAMALLEPGWETDYESRPPIEEFACLGKVVAHHRLDDGHYNVLLLGVERVRIARELDPLRSFRQAKVEIVEDCYDFAKLADREVLQDRLVTSFRKHLPCACQLPEQLEDMLSRHLPLGLLTDLASYALPLDIEVKQKLLAEPRVGVRARMLLAQIQQQFAGQKPAITKADFPPHFSEN
jgi:Lon protease-like protein